MRRFLGLLGLAATVAAPSSATVIVRAVPSASVIAVGETFNLDLRADVSDPVVGFGIDLLFDASVLVILGDPAIGPAWTPVFAPDGDGLAGLALGAGLAGDDLLLATLELRGLAPGATALAPSVTTGDLAEGFPLDPSGFDADLVLESAAVTVVPEPRRMVPFAALLLVVQHGIRRRRVGPEAAAHSAMGPR